MAAISISSFEFTLPWNFYGLSEGKAQSRKRWSWNCSGRRWQTSA